MALGIARVVRDVCHRSVGPRWTGVRTVLLAMVWSTVSIAGPLRAQAGRVEGVVIEPSSGLPIPNVEVRLIGTEYVARTDSLGAFRLKLDEGNYLVRATRLGFGPRSIALAVAANDTVTMSIEMDILPIQLAEVFIRAKEEKYRGKMLGFAQRMRTSGAARSSFITRDEIERRAPLQLSDMIKERGGRVGACTGKATIWLDGAMLLPDNIGEPRRGRRTEPNQKDMRLDLFPVHEIEAVEVYPGGATTPAEFSATAAPGLAPGCTIVMWTR